MPELKDTGRIGEGTIKRVPWINARDYGVRASDGVDDATQLQNVLDSVAVTGGVVVLPPGEYRLDSTVTVPSGVTLAAANDGVTFTGAGATPAFIESVTNLTGGETEIVYAQSFRVIDQSFDKTIDVLDAAEITTDDIIVVEWAGISTSDDVNTLELHAGTTKIADVLTTENGVRRLVLWHEDGSWRVLNLALNANAIILATRDSTGADPASDGLNLEFTFIPSEEGTLDANITIRKYARRGDTS